MTEVDIAHLRQWIGREERKTDVLTVGLAERFRATLGTDALAPGDTLPLAIHWCLAPAAVPPGDIGEDGHPARGGFLPPVPLPRRMWASGNVEFLAPLRVGDDATRTSTVQSVTHKRGGTGDLVFVTVAHEIRARDVLAIRETQNLVYREDPDPNAPAPRPVAPPAPAEFGRAWVPDPVLLFRYSALTFNGHRIHYDRDYAMGEEGYAGLVVHGPLAATLLLDLVRAELPGAEVAQYDYRAVRPLIDGNPFRVEGCRTDAGLSLWALDHTGAVTMQATATLRNAG